MQIPIWIAEARNYSLESIRQHWQKFHWLFNLLQLAAIVCAICWWHWIPYPGYAIGVLAVVAAVMAVHADMRVGHKVVWLLIIGAFLVIEFRAIDKDRAEFARGELEKRRVENDNFKSIAGGITEAINDSDRNFNATMGKTNQVLLNITGGNSFAYVSPQNFFGDQFPGVVWNNGEQALMGVTITIAHTSDPNWGEAFYKPIIIGTIGAHQHAPIPDFVFQPRADVKTGQDHYWIMLSAQNGTVSQGLYFRRDHNNPANWAYSFSVSKQTDSGKPQPQKMLLKPWKGIRKTTDRMLLFRAWSDDLVEPGPKR